MNLIQLGDMVLTSVTAWVAIVRAFVWNVASPQATLGLVFSMNVTLSLLTCSPIEWES